MLELAFGKQLERLRLSKKKQQKEFADLIGMTTTRYNRIENGTRLAGIDDVQKVINASPISASYFFENIDPRLQLALDRKSYLLLRLITLPEDKLQKFEAEINSEYANAMLANTNMPLHEIFRVSGSEVAVIQPLLNSFGNK